MLARVDPTRTRAWQRLKAHHRELKKVHLADLFRRDPRRFSRFSIRFEDLLIDYSKNRITAETLRLLFGLAKECRLKEAIEKMFTGERINETEGRAVLHVALRNRSNWPICVDGKDVMGEVDAVLARMESFSERLLGGQWKGYTGRRISDLVHIGIGGANLGPSMVTEALRPYWRTELRTHFVSNVDGSHIAETLQRRGSFGLVAGITLLWSPIPRDDPLHRLLEILYDSGNSDQCHHGQEVVSRRGQG